MPEAAPPLPDGGLRVIALGGLGEVGRNMTVLELSEFVEAFKTKFNVTAMAAAPVAAPAYLICER